MKKKIGLLILAISISQFGSALSYFMLVAYMASILSTAVTASLMTVYAISYIVAVSFSGSLADRCSRFKIACVYQILAAVALWGLSAFISKGIAQTDNHVFLVVILLALVNGGTDTIDVVLLPSLTDEETEIYKANVWLTISRRGILVFVGLLGVWFLSKQLFVWSFFLDGCTYVISGVIYYRLLKITENKKLVPLKIKKAKDYFDVFVYLKHSKRYSRKIWIILFFNLALSPVGIFLPYLAMDRFKKIAYAGYLDAAYTAGVFCLGLLIWVPRIFFVKRLGEKTLIVGFLVFYVMFTLANSFLFTVVAIFSMGFLALKLLIDLRTELQHMLPAELLGKTLSVLAIGLKIAKPFSLLLLALWTSYYTRQSFLLFMSFIVLITGVGAIVSINFRRGSKTMQNFELKFEDVKKRLFSNVDMDMGA